MKYLLLNLLFSFCFSLSVFACSCSGEWSFCNYIQSDYFEDRGGIVCTVELTGNGADFGAEVKITELLYGEIQPGFGNYLNTDSTLWMMYGNTSCNDWFRNGNAGTQYVIAPIYQYDGFTGEFGYQLFLCAYDVFQYNTTMYGPIINDLNFYPDYFWQVDTIMANQLPELVTGCSTCLFNLDLWTTHNWPSVYKASSMLSSTATVNADVIYQANDRVRLKTGFKTNEAIQFGVVIEDCD